MTNFVQTQVLVVGVIDEARTFNGCGETMGKALLAAKKQARAFARRHKLSVRQDNCTQIPAEETESGIFTYQFVDYVP